MQRLTVEEINVIAKRQLGIGVGIAATPTQMALRTVLVEFGIALMMYQEEKK